MYVWSALSAQCRSTGYDCQSCLWSPEKGELFSTRPCSRQKNRSRDTGGFGRPVPRQPAHPAHARTEPGFYSRDPLLSPAFRDGVHTYRRSPSGQSRVHWVTQVRATPMLDVCAYTLVPLLAPPFREGVHPFCQPPFGQSRVYSVTQLRTDGVRRQESVGTGPVILKVVRVTDATYYESPIAVILYVVVFLDPLFVYNSTV